MTCETVDEFSSKGVSLILTLDCGIRDVNEIAHAAELGIETIVCDHHEPDTVLPGAIIINPKLEDSRYPFRDLAGVGVAFKLSHAILMSYLPGFSKRFLIIAEEQGVFQNAIVVNGEVIQSEDSLTAEQLLLSADNSDYIIYQLDAPGLISLEQVLNGRKCFDLNSKEFNKFNSAIIKSKGKLNHSNIVINDYPGIRKIDQAVIRFLEIQYDNTPKIREFNEYILSFVALGSIADIVPLTGENRILVQNGIESLNNTNHGGLAKLIENRQVNAKTIGWHVAPILNAPGRMGKTDYTAEFLLQNGKGDPDVLLAEIIRLNELRKGIVSDYCSKIFSDIATGEIDSTKPLIFLEIDAPEGVAGLIANRITDTINKPVIVITRLENSSLVKGSGRVRGGFNFFKCIEPLSHLLEKIGGHAHAFGFTLESDRVEEFRKNAEKIIQNTTIEEAVIEIDFELAVDQITGDLINTLDVLEPYGHHNPEPLFISRNVSVSHFKRFGADNRHGKFLFNGNSELEAIGWGIADEMEKRNINDRMNIIYRLEKSVYNGKNAVTNDYC